MDHLKTGIVAGFAAAHIGRAIHEGFAGMHTPSPESGIKPQHAPFIRDVKTPRIQSKRRTFPTRRWNARYLLPPHARAYAHCMSEELTPTGFDPPADDAERTRDFLSRHGGPGVSGPRRGQSNGGLQGWSETQAADGWILRCDWSRLGTVEEIKYSEILAPERS